VEVIVGEVVGEHHFKINRPCDRHLLVDHRQVAGRSAALGLESHDEAVEKDAGEDVLDKSKTEVLRDVGDDSLAKAFQRLALLFYVEVIRKEDVVDYFIERNLLKTIQRRKNQLHELTRAENRLLRNQIAPQLPQILIHVRIAFPLRKMDKVVNRPGPHKRRGPVQTHQRPRQLRDQFQKLDVVVLLFVGHVFF
jgi:hypothetical protein